MIWVEYLTNLGYKVLSASTLDEAVRVLDKEWVHLIIQDIRMINDNDETDVSGLLLVKDEKYRQIPKIVLTAFPSYEAVRIALGPVADGLPPAVEFIAKTEGPKALGEAVGRVFKEFVKINRDLQIEWEARDRFALVTFLAPKLQEQTLLHRADEFTDLFCRLFFEYVHIRIVRLFWQQSGRIALATLAFKNGAPPDSYLVVCGLKPTVETETQRHQEFSPKAPGVHSTVLVQTAQTIHFAANAYVLANANLARLRSLETIYRTEPPRGIKTTLTTLVDNSLAAWHRGEWMVDEKYSLDEHYRQRLGLTPASVSQQEMESRLGAVLQQTSTLGIHLRLGREQLTVEFGRQPLTFPNPLVRAYQEMPAGPPVIMLVSPGNLTGDNILAETSEQVWLTDFAEAGIYPLLWNFIALEAVIRYDWSHAEQFVRLHELEQALIELPFAASISREVEPEVRESARTINDLRQLVVPLVGRDEIPYHLGMFYQAMHRLAAPKAGHYLTRAELSRLAHILLSASMLAEKLQRRMVAPPLQTCLTLDHATHTVMIGNKRVVLSRQGYELLHYLHEHVNQPCKREAIYREVFDIKDFERLSLGQKKTEENRLNAAIRRLRESLEDDANNPRFLTTEAGFGYRLVDCPDA